MREEALEEFHITSRLPVEPPITINSGDMVICFFAIFFLSAPPVYILIQYWRSVKILLFPRQDIRDFCRLLSNKVSTRAWRSFSK